MLTSKDGLKGTKYTCRYKWPDNITVQHGSRGIVFSKRGNYSTAFFEAFPSLEITNSYIRGEGESVELAELDAFNKYEKMAECKEHQYKRKGKSESGICEYCSSVKHDIFPPSEDIKCMTCNKPSSNFYFNGIEVITDENNPLRSSDNYCLQHYKEKLFSEKIKTESLRDFKEVSEDVASDVVSVLYNYFSLLELGNTDSDLEDYEVNRLFKAKVKEVKSLLRGFTQYAIYEMKEQGGFVGHPDHLQDVLFMHLPVEFAILTLLDENDDKDALKNLLDNRVYPSFYAKIIARVNSNMLHTIKVESEDFNSMLSRIKNA